MASRKEAKDSVIAKDDNDAELANASDLQLDLKKEDNRHKEAIAQQKLGIVGGLFGDGQNTPTVAALVTVIACFIIAVGLYIAAFHQSENADLWTKNAERAMAIALAALAYVFGKGGK
jgi:hypothetical protein